MLPGIPSSRGLPPTTLSIPAAAFSLPRLMSPARLALAAALALLPSARRNGPGALLPLLPVAVSTRAVALSGGVVPLAVTLPITLFPQAIFFVSIWSGTILPAALVVVVRSVRGRAIPVLFMMGSGL